MCNFDVLYKNVCQVLGVGGPFSGNYSPYHIRYKINQSTIMLQINRSTISQGIRDLLPIFSFFCIKF